MSPGKISLTFDLESLSVSIDTAIPCGLILNEACISFLGLGDSLAVCRASATVIGTSIMSVIVDSAIMINNKNGGLSSH